MAKAVLVLDMPENCSDCCLCNNGYCTKKLMCCNFNTEEKRAEWCPIKELPQKQIHHNTDTPHHRWAMNGWNACLNEILKEE